jgi:AraC family transcriptional activator of pobA
MEREYQEKGQRYEEAVKASLHIFFIELARINQDNQPAKVNFHHQERLDEFRELLEVNIFTHKQVTDYAEMLHLSVYQLNAIVKSTLVKTCSELIQPKRV